MLASLRYISLCFVFVLLCFYAYFFGFRAENNTITDLSIYHHTPYQDSLFFAKSAVSLPYSFSDFEKFFPGYDFVVNKDFYNGLALRLYVYSFLVCPEQKLLICHLYSKETSKVYKVCAISNRYFFVGDTVCYRTFVNLWNFIHHQGSSDFRVFSDFSSFVHYQKVMLGSYCLEYFPFKGSGGLSACIPECFSISVDLQPLRDAATQSYMVSH